MAHKPDWTADAPAPHDMDYFVPNFGRDKDIIAGEENLKVAEGMYNHTWVWKDKSRSIPPVVPYYANGLHPDADIVATTQSLATAETDLGYTWSL